MASENQDLKHFSSITWCAELLQNPEFVVARTGSRIPKDNGEDALWGKTLNTEDTISAFLVLYRQPKPGVTRIEELKILLTLESGLNGFRNMCHGGMVGAIIDEVMGILLVLNKKRGAIEGRFPVTAYLNTTYLKPVPTPANILVTATLEEVKGKKYIVAATMQDGSGTILAKAESLWIAAAKEKL